MKLSSPEKIILIIILAPFVAVMYVGAGAIIAHFIKGILQ